MRRDFSDEFILSCLKVNAALRAEVRGLAQSIRERREWKYNPNWRQQPRAPKGTLSGGQWIEGGKSPPTVPKDRGRPAPRGHNRPPEETLLTIFPSWTARRPRTRSLPR